MFGAMNSAYRQTDVDTYARKTALETSADMA